MIVIILEPISQVSVLVSLQTMAWCGSGNMYMGLALSHLSCIHSECLLRKNHRTMGVIVRVGMVGIVGVRTCLELCRTPHFTFY